MTEQTFVMIKPDGVQRALTGEIITRLERTGLKLVGLRMVWVDDKLSRQHYTEHLEKPFYPDMEKFITEAPVVALVLEGDRAVSAVRKLIGATKPEDAQPGTIRGDYAHALGDSRNIIHASANADDAKREIELWFQPEELHNYKRADERHTLHQ